MLERVCRSLGPAGEEWLAGVPELVASACDRWGLEVGYALHGWGDALSLRAVRGDQPVVLKLTVPALAHPHEAEALRAADGRGYVRLLDEDPTTGALLTEALGPSLERQIQLNPALADGTLTPVTQTLMAAWQLPLPLADEVDEETHRAAVLRRDIVRFSTVAGASEYAAAIDRALAYATQRLDARTPQRQVVVHGNPYPGNFQSCLVPRPGAESGYVLANPRAFRCEREYDLGVVLRDAHRSLFHADDSVVLLRSWCARLADTTGTDAEAVWQWGFIERVWAGLQSLSRGFHAEGQLYLQTAAWLISRRYG